ncbi:unnamed protein product, partial [Ixodes hexagonus]
LALGQEGVPKADVAVFVGMSRRGYQAGRAHKGKVARLLRVARGTLKKRRGRQKKGLAFGDVTPTCHRLRLPSPSVTPNLTSLEGCPPTLLPCWLNRRLVTLANVPASLGVDTGWACPHSHRLTEPSWQPDK